ncbi:MAG TPA: RagB/SusD family nutrient uptake outer membrane protein [Gemmatimonas sp.]|nr:RagB/SusD family nutrient uptake outer membrane protein [Gemmatimonas sp.]
MAGDQATALAAANLVARTGPAAFSQLTFPAPTINPFANVTGGTQGIAVRRQFRLSMQPQDQRFAYFVTPSTTLTGRVGALLDPFSRWANPQAPYPVYMPDEALLIKAEALVVQGNAAAAQAALDSVRTDCTGGRGIDDPKACLPPLSAQLSNADLLTEIYTQRRYELFGTGLRWEDARRRSTVRGPVAAPAVPVDAQRCWLPYAFGERNANPNATFAALPDPVEPSTFPSGCQAQ